MNVNPSFIANSNKMKSMTLTLLSSFIEVMTHSGKWFADRLINETFTDDHHLSPIYGYQTQPLVSLETALEPIQAQINGLCEYRSKQRRNVVIIQPNTVWRRINPQWCISTRWNGEAIFSIAYSMWLFVAKVARLSNSSTLLWNDCPFESRMSGVLYASH